MVHWPGAALSLLGVASLVLSGAALNRRRLRPGGLVLGCAAVVLAVGGMLGAGSWTVYERRMTDRIISGVDVAVDVADGVSEEVMSAAMPEYQAGWVKREGYAEARQKALLGLAALPGLALGAASLVLALIWRRRRAQASEPAAARRAAVTCLVAGAASFVSTVSVAALPVPNADPPPIAAARMARQRLERGLDDGACESLEAALRANDTASYRSEPAISAELARQLPEWHQDAQRCAALWQSELEANRVPRAGCFRRIATSVVVRVTSDGCQFSQLCPDPDAACECTHGGCARRPNRWRSCSSTGSPAASTTPSVATQPLAAPVCVAGSARCVGTARQACGHDGQWGPKFDCNHSNPCRNGRCVPWTPPAPEL